MPSHVSLRNLAVGIPDEDLKSQIPAQLFVQRDIVCLYFKDLELVRVRLSLGFFRFFLLRNTDPIAKMPKTPKAANT